MRFTWLITKALITTLPGFWLGGQPAAGSPAPAATARRWTTEPPAAVPPASTGAAPALVRALIPAPPRRAPLAAPAQQPRAGRRDSLVQGALRQLGVPYVYAGSSPATGFDCSGFVRYVFGRFGVAVPHAAALLIGVGQPVARAQAQPGDIVVFTGTAAGSTTPGHAGIVVSARGEQPLRFVHASSARRAAGVKLSQVEGTDYERRFMQVRRVEL